MFKKLFFKGYKNKDKRVDFNYFELFDVLFESNFDGCEWLCFWVKKLFGFCSRSKSWDKLKDWENRSWLVLLLRGLFFKLRWFSLIFFL